MKYQIDTSAAHCNVALGLCECGARFIALNATAARERLAAHETQVHPADMNVRKAIQDLERRRRKARAN